MVFVIRRGLRRDERGVASTVGTIMALLVFLTFLSLIVNQYVPVWMKDSEAAHMDGAVGQFANLKGAIDFQALGALMAQNAGAVFVPSTTSTAVTLGVDGVPIFSSPSTGALRSNPDQGNWTVWFQYEINGVVTTVDEASSGQIDLSVQNRYYPIGDIVYENGAVIRSQPDGQVVRAAPTFQASHSGSTLSVAFQLVNLYGSGAAAGTSTQIINTKVFAVNQQTYNLTSALYVNHTSPFGLGWFNFFNSTLSTSLGVKPTTTVSPPFTTVTATVNGTTLYTLRLENLGTGSYRVRLAVYNLAYSLFFTLQQAYVDVGVGQSSSIV
jgi:hypothetical protein